MENKRNYVELVGEIIGLIKFKATQDGSIVCNFTLAVEKNDEGDKYFHPCASFGDVTEKIKLLGIEEGNLVQVIGKLKRRPYKVGETQRMLSYVAVEEIEKITPTSEKKNQ